MHVFEELVLYPETTIYEVQIEKKFPFSRYQKTIFFHFICKDSILHDNYWDYVKKT